MHSGHHNSLQEGECLHREGFVEVFALDVEADFGVADGYSVLGGTEEHSWSVVVLVINDVHLVVSVILLFLLYISNASALQHHNLVIAFLDDLVFRLFFLDLEVRVEASPADGLLQQQVLLILLEILTNKLLLLRWLPLPTIADLNQMIPRPLELIRRQFSRKLEHVLLWRRAPLLAQLLHSLVEQILAPVQ